MSSDVEERLLPDESDEIEAVFEADRKEHAAGYLCFLVLGAVMLLPWNTLTVCFPFFHSRLLESSFASSYSSWLSLSFTFFNFTFLFHANISHSKSTHNTRISSSILLMACALLSLTLSTRFDTAFPNLYFVFLLLLCVILAASTAYLQNALTALSSSFGPVYLQAVMAGQGIVGVAVSVVQMISATATAKTTTMSTTAQEIDKALTNGTFVFLITATAFCTIAFFSHIVLINLPSFKPTPSSFIKRSPEDTVSLSSRLAQMLRVERHIRPLGLSVMFIFLVTLTVFPSVTTTITSTSQNSDYDPNSHTTWTSDLLFIPLSFVIFNVGDWTGRSLPAIPTFQWATNGSRTSVRKLSLATISRLAFIPLFFACNVTPRQGTPLINSDFAYMIILFAFALTNGYFSTLIMIAGINKSVIPQQDIEIAAICLVQYLTLGLASGSLMSFGARAVMCGCNPFVTV